MKIKYSHFIFWLLVFSPILDNITGILLQQGRDTNLSVNYKMILFLVCLYVAVLCSSRSALIKGIIIGIAMIFQLIMFEMGMAGSWSYNISVLIKLLMPVVLVLAFTNLRKVDEDIPGIIDKITEYYCWFFPISLLIPYVLNISNATYRDGTGSKGFYFAGNEISAIMVIILALSLKKFLINRNKKTTLNLGCVIISMMFIGTKSCFIALAVEIVAVALSMKNTRKNLINILLAIPVLGAVVYFVFNLQTFAQLIETWIWRYNNRGSGMMDFLLSGRREYLEETVENVYDKQIWLKVLFGGNPNYVVNELKGLVEMDFIDLFIWFGVAMTAFIIIFYMKYMIQVIREKNMFFIISLGVIYATSVFSGHVIFAPMVTIVLALFFLNISEGRLNEVEHES